MIYSIMIRQLIILLSSNKKTKKFVQKIITISFAKLIFNLENKQTLSKQIEDESH